MKKPNWIFPWLAALSLLITLNCRAALPATPAPAATRFSQPSATTNPTVHSTSAVRYYDIQGSSASKLRQQMSALGPPDPKSGQIFDARTDWEIAWRFYYQRSLTGGCSIARAEVDVNLTFTFPRWLAPADAAPGLIKKWESYQQALKAHEQQHADLAIAGGEEIYNAILAVPPAATCPDLENAANAAARQRFDQIQARQEAYDSETNHGATQGAVFP
ncbi:MAG: hypothetical protein Fur0035_00360 [Anaerolineales bacterium]